jgi:solute carrier family 25 phosphate transporter 3
MASIGVEKLRQTKHVKISSVDGAAARPGEPNDSENDEFITQADRICWTTFLTTAALVAGVAGFLAYLAWETPMGTAIRMHSFDYFLVCMLGGVLSGLPHTILTPIDIIKCRVQVGEYASLGEGFHQILHVDARGSYIASIPHFFRGWTPTFIGYSMQGALKYGLYEYFKYTYTNIFVPDAGAHHAGTVWLYLAASCTAEVFADMSLAPWEAVKIKMQTTRTYPPVLSIVVPRVWASEGLHGFFKGLPPLWVRQVPYTMMKFASFEKIVQLLYSVVLRGPKKSFSSPVQLAVSLAGGCLAGALCALVSHPADTLVSKLNQRHDAAKGVMSLLRELSCADLWKGIGLRIVMIGTLTAMQWVFYDSFKLLVGLPTTGGGHHSPVATFISEGTLSSVPAGGVLE